VATREKTAIYRFDDTEMPGLARVKLLKHTRTLLGFKVWQVEVVEIVRPSIATMKSSTKVGQRKEVSEKHLQMEPSSAP
jgi:hypothetical protein